MADEYVVKFPASSFTRIMQPGRPWEITIFSSSGTFSYQRPLDKDWAITLGLPVEENYPHEPKAEEHT